MNPENQECFIVYKVNNEDTRTSDQSLTLLWCLCIDFCIVFRIDKNFINCFSVFIDNFEHVVVLGCNLKIINITKSTK